MALKHELDELLDGVAFYSTELRCLVPVRAFVYCAKMDSPEKAAVCGVSLPHASNMTGTFLHLVDRRFVTMPGVGKKSLRALKQVPACLISFCSLVQPAATKR